MSVKRWVLLTSVVVTFSCTAAIGAESETEGIEAQVWSNVHRLLAEPMPADEDSLVAPLAYSDALSLVLIRLRTGVKAHYHERHTETVIILSGSGRFQVGDSEKLTGPGDVVMVPPGTIHAFTVIGSEPVAAISSMSPGFDGKDRIFVENE